jgi:tRNA pseudouridine32 synthase / 23S rRNA pseudouridine746 synthase
VFPQHVRCAMAPLANSMQMRVVMQAPINSETHIELLQMVDHPNAGPLGRYKLRALTGQKHQLRVHMAMLGLPLYGERMYPVFHPPDDPPDYTHPLRLLAQQLMFTCPLSGATHTFRSQRQLML